ncbi:MULTISPECIES: NACHT domain-containing NTPase [Cyanophyceae]|uniref:NACHT domain-containing protein n=1 Tax=Cyanophyceae TaxID=3028117 RepID=UPI001687FFF3|nr:MULTISPECIES: NACHT domain-containing NTPase [Cyanophyceae]MBD1916658.1 NACHT domain-containing NTPase [Phormidium sp. FACHB-77]MBD2030015.1 NACHT domain-containing NTPase [Phormidium sp. FACHB-322]MBD2053226.1 NACHT domain-containing NTPase [Leptolyngbya sp. FACHB-60]
MAKPSLRATSQGVEMAGQALTRMGLTQARLAEQVGCSRQPITNFFKGEAISQAIFMQICERLGLDWQAIAGLAAPISRAPNPPAAPPPTVTQPSLDALVQTLRRQVYPSIRERCDTMRVLDMSHPVAVNDIYASVNILEQISGRRYRRVEELLHSCDASDFERLGLGAIAEERMPALDAVKTYRKLIILGKPGAGKTTFLKHLAIQCNEGKFESDYVPIFITLKDFAEAEDEPSLLGYIADCYPSIETVNLNLVDSFHQLFAAGKALLLLDGLDEVRGEDHQRVIKEIRAFSECFRQNQFIITCRIASWDYVFEKFTEVEVADFDWDQIEAFASKWFSQKSVKSAQFLRQLNQRPRLKQLATSPLLLTLICLAFEESCGFPSSRSELYKEGIDALLKKWDAKRGIQRDQVYKNLSHLRKKDLLSYLALITFKGRDLFFKESVAERHIADYICNLSEVDAAPEALQIDSEVILRSIEAQHGLLIERAKGIYSFSHLTFHEFFVAREIAINSLALEQALRELANHGADKRWREVILLTTEMLRDASLLLLPLKQTIDQLLADSPRLQQFLQEVSDRATAPEFTLFKPAAARAFCFDIDFDIDENRAVALALDKTVNLLVCASFLTRMMEDLSLAEAIAVAQAYDAQANAGAQLIAAGSANAVMLIAIQIALDSGSLDTPARQTLKTLWQRLKGHAADDDDTVREVADQAREVAKRRHHIGQDWHFTPSEKTRLKHYYTTTLLLVECLNSDGCMLSPQLRQSLQASLFLPLP